MAERNELVAYAMDFASYLVSKEKDIDRIILYGSVAKDNFDEDSDIDIFIDTDKKNAKKLIKLQDNYYNTKKYREWQLKGIKNAFSIITGKLDGEEWKDLKRSMINSGIMLYGKYKADGEKISQYVLFSFENIKPDKKRVSVYRTLFGFKQGSREYKGMAEKINATRTGKGCLLVPAEYANDLKKFFQGKKVTAKIFDLWSDIKL
jgi:predicted nucleotidyltransferase